MWEHIQVAVAVDNQLVAVDNQLVEVDNLVEVEDNLVEAVDNLVEAVRSHRIDLEERYFLQEADSRTLEAVPC